MAKDNITLIPTAQLIEELAARHDGLIVAGIKFTTTKNFSLTKHWGGNHFICLGILQDTIHQVNKNGDRSYTQE